MFELLYWRNGEGVVQVLFDTEREMMEARRRMDDLGYSTSVSYISYLSEEIEKKAAARDPRTVAGMYDAALATAKLVAEARRRK